MVGIQKLSFQITKTVKLISSRYVWCYIFQTLKLKFRIEISNIVQITGNLVFK